MKKSIFIFLLPALLLTEAKAQRFVYVDTDYILDNIPDFHAAQKKIDDIAEEWRQEINQKYEEIEKLYKAYQAEQILMPEEVKIRKQQEIEEKEKAVRELQKQRFGFEGDLFKKKQELIKPIQDRVYNEIQKMATEKAYDFVFDKAGGPYMLFSSPKYDKSDEIIRSLGYTPSSGKSLQKE
ncbi:MAG: membrane protein [Chitinophagales bacterium]|nr:MAG: membrane protein [Chitinophagales bacterium]